jgi:hypothetical protein
MNIYHHTLSMGQKFGSSLIGILAQSFSGGHSQSVDRGYGHVTSTLEGLEGPFSKCLMHMAICRSPGFLFVGCHTS